VLDPLVPLLVALEVPEFASPTTVTTESWSTGEMR
jgi:hypothetical protein